MRNIGATLTEDLLSVLFPPLCPCCGATMVRGEKPLCLSCRMKLPLTGHEKSPTSNDLINKLQGIIAFERAAAYFTYRREAPQARLLHDMKYHSRPEIGRQLAAEYSRTLLAAGFFDSIDAVAPVPLNFWRHCRRGYNQSAHIAAGAASAPGLPVIDALRARRHSSQTRLSATGRLEALKGIFSARPDSLRGINHLLLVDDICTTGATLYACAEALRAVRPDLRISAFVLASTSLL